MYANDDKSLLSQPVTQMPSYSGMMDIQAPSNMFGTSVTPDRPSTVPSYSGNIWSAENYDVGSSAGMAKEPSYNKDVTSALMSESMGNCGSMFSGDRKRSHNQAAMADYDYASYGASQNWSDYGHDASGRPGPKKSRASPTAPGMDYFNETVQMMDAPWDQGSSYQMHGDQESNGMAKGRQQNQQSEIQVNEESGEPSNWNEIKTLLTHLSKHKSLSKLLGEASKELFQEEMAERSGQGFYSGGQNYGHEQTDYNSSDQWNSTPRQRGQSWGGRAKQIGRGQSTSQYGYGQSGQSRGQSGQSRGQFGRGRGRGTGRGNDRQSSNYISSGGHQGTGSRGKGQRGRGHDLQDGNSSSNFVTGDGQSSRGRGFGTRGRGQMGRGQESRGRGMSFRHPICDGQVICQCDQTTNILCFIAALTICL